MTSKIFISIWLFNVLPNIVHVTGSYNIFGKSKECPSTYITYHLYTQRNPRTPVILKNGASVDEISDYLYVDWDIPNKVILHGFNSNVTLTQLLDIKNEYLRTNKHNVWMIDWAPLAKGPNYFLAVSNLDHVAKCISPLLLTLIEMSTFAPSSYVHVIGFSLGGQLAAYVANHLRPFKLHRITGLDPAMPLFTGVSKDGKLDKSDALFVDVIHTDMSKQGKQERCGHVDFYMNGGVHQPGCWSKNLATIPACNHHRALDYFAESINSEVGFWGTPCDNFLSYMIGMCDYENPITLMGEHVEFSSTGYYIVPTTDKRPFAMGKKTDPTHKIQIRHSPMEKDLYLRIINEDFSKDEILEYY